VGVWKKNIDAVTPTSRRHRRARERFARASDVSDARAIERDRVARVIAWRRVASRATIVRADARAVETIDARSSEDVTHPNRPVGDVDARGDGGRGDASSDGVWVGV